MQNNDDTPLPPGPFHRIQAEIVVATYLNATIEDDQGTHFGWSYVTPITS